VAPLLPQPKIFFHLSNVLRSDTGDPAHVARGCEVEFNVDVSGQDRPGGHAKANALRITPLPPNTIELVQLLHTAQHGFVHKVAEPGLAPGATPGGGGGGRGTANHGGASERGAAGGLTIGDRSSYDDPRGGVRNPAGETSEEPAAMQHDQEHTHEQQRQPQQQHRRGEHEHRCWGRIHVELAKQIHNIFYAMDDVSTLAADREFSESAPPRIGEQVRAQTRRLTYAWMTLIDGRGLYVTSMLCRCNVTYCVISGRQNSSGRPRLPWFGRRVLFLSVRGPLRALARCNPICRTQTGCLVCHSFCCCLPAKCHPISTSICRRRAQVSLD
jgi:hypothetical protein